MRTLSVCLTSVPCLPACLPAFLPSNRVVFVTLPIPPLGSSNYQICSLFPCCDGTQFGLRLVLPVCLPYGTVFIAARQLAVLQAACNNLERSLRALQTSPLSARSTAGLLGAAPAMAPASPWGPAGGGGRGGAGFVPVRPARRSTLMHDENEGASPEPGCKICTVDTP